MFWGTLVYAHGVDLSFLTRPYLVTEGSAVLFDYFDTKPRAVPLTDIASWRWDFDNDGTWDRTGTISAGINATWYAVFDEDRSTNGVMRVTSLLQVTDTNNVTDTQTGITEDIYGSDGLIDSYITIIEASIALLQARRTGSVPRLECSASLAEGVDESGFDQFRESRLEGGAAVSSHVFESLENHVMVDAIHARDYGAIGSASFAMDSYQSGLNQFFSSPLSVPRSASLSFEDEQSFRDQSCEPFADRVAACPVVLDGSGNGQEALCFDEFQQHPLRRAQPVECFVQGIDSATECVRLTVQHEEEELQPGFPIGLVLLPNGFLRGAKGSVIVLLVLFDDGLDGCVGRMGVSGPQKQEGGQNAGEASVSILEGMDLEKDDDVDADHEQGMQVALSFTAHQPSGQFLHFPGGVEGRGGFENNADLLAVGIENGNAIGEGFVGSPVPFVFDAVSQEDTMQLSDVILGGGQQLGRIENHFHGPRISGDLLLIAGVERFGLQSIEQGFNLVVGEFSSFNACRGTDAFNCRGTSKTGQHFRRQPSNRFPTPLEFVDFGHETRKGGTQSEVFWFDQHDVQLIIRFYPFVNRFRYPFIYPFGSDSGEVAA